MAVTEILGTDSLSSSRITLNDNFVELQDKIDDINGFLSTSAATLTGVAITATQLTVQGGTSLVNVTASDLVVTGGVDFQGTIIKSSVDGTIANGVTSLGPTYSKHTYFVDGSQGQISLPAGIHGQEIFLIADSATSNNNTPVAFDPSTISGITTAELLATGAAVELRCVDSGNGNLWWYVIGRSGQTDFS